MQSLFEFPEGEKAISNQPLRISVNQLTPPFKQSQIKCVLENIHPNLLGMKLSESFQHTKDEIQLYWALELISDYLAGASNATKFEENGIFKVEVEVGPYRFEILLINGEVNTIVSSINNGEGTYIPAELDEFELSALISVFLQDTADDFYKDNLNDWLSDVVAIQSLYKKKLKKITRGIFSNSIMPSTFAQLIWKQYKVNINDLKTNRDEIAKALSDYIIQNLRIELLNSFFPEDEIDNFDFGLIQKNFDIVKSALRIFVKIILSGYRNSTDSRDLYKMGEDLYYFMVAKTDPEFTPDYNFDSPELSFKALLGNSEYLFLYMFDLVVDVWNYVAENVKNLHIDDDDIDADLLEI